MNDYYQLGDQLEYRYTVKHEDIAKFDSGIVHEVYSTFSLTRDAEWTCRQFVLKMRDDGEEGIGTFVHIKHVSPALVGSEVLFKATLSGVKGNEVICTFQATVKGRIIAEGEIGQKIINKVKIDKLFNELEQR